jgi:signal transduction histidine kinase
MPAEPAPGYAVRGPGYIAGVITVVSISLGLLINTVRRNGTVRGIRRLESQFLSINLSASLSAALLCTSFGNWFHQPWLKFLSFIIFFSAYLLAAWAMTFHRVFDAQQILLSLAHRISIVAVIVIVALGLRQLLHHTIPTPSDFIIGIILSIWPGFWLERRSRSWLQLDGRASLAELRNEVISIARTEPNAGCLIASFEKALSEHFNTAFATLVVQPVRATATSPLHGLKRTIGFYTLCESGWITPESVLRRRTNPALQDLATFLEEKAISAIVAIPRGSPTPATLIALGTKSNGWAFTFPEVQRLQNVGELIDNILTRSHLTAEAALKAKAEHLAIMSRGVAHDLKNLITPVSSFLVHTEGNSPSDSVESEVHAAAKRSVRIMTEYVREALFFSERLEPRFEQIDIGSIFHRVREIAADRARDRGVVLVFIGDQTSAMTADAVLLQRLLANLVSNAIDASTHGQEVHITVTNDANEWVRFRVADNGCGIRAEHLDRVFDPYFTTKQFGDETRGFGLGLTISEKIVNLHSGRISIASAVGTGSTVIVELPIDRRSVGQTNDASSTR